MRAIPNKLKIGMASCMLFTSLAGAIDTPPNVILIYADDLGYSDIGYNAPAGSLAYTPNIDRICNEGIYLSNYLTHYVCTPSRAGVMTGRHYTRVGSGLNVNGTLDNSLPNIAKDFQKAGYTTGCFGKWHSSDPNLPTNGKSQEVNYNDVKVYSDVHQDFTAPLDNGLFDKSFPRAWGEGVNAYGFDRYVGFYSGLVDYFDKYIRFYRDVNWWHDGDYVPDEPGYLTDLISQHSVAFVETNQASPFFCFVSHGCVHAPYDILRSDLEEMCNIVDDEHPTLAWTNVMMLASPITSNLVRDAEDMRCSTDFEFDMDVLETQLPGFHDLVYYTMIYSMDKSVGVMLDKLDELGQTTNSIIVFTSDNGGTTRADNTPFRGTKHQIYEGGIHVPAAIWWPGTLDANQAPYAPGDNVYSNLTQYLDLYPTLINMTESTLYGTDLDGINLTSNLMNRTSARLDYDGCYFGIDDYWASTRNERWKLHFNRLTGNDHVLELYDLWNDVAESNNVESIYTAERDALIAQQDQWFSSGDVTTSFMPLTGDSLPPYTKPAPAGDILEITATQTKPISGPNNGVSVSFSDPSFKSLNIYDDYVQANDVIEYDLYVATDSDQVNGFFCSPSRSSKPLFSTERGMHPSGSMLHLYSMPKGEWIRVAAGVGDVAPSTSRPQYIGLFNASPGTYHFYIDNVVIRREDGTIRAVVWNNRNDSDQGPNYYYNRTKYNTWAAATAIAGFPFSDISLNTTDLSTLETDPDAGTNVLSITPATGIGIDYPVWADNASDTAGNGSNTSTGNAQVGDIFGTDNVRRSVFAFDIDDSLTPLRLESAVLKLYYRGANNNAIATGGAVSLHHSEAADFWSGSSVEKQRDWFNLGWWTDTGLDVVSTPTENIGYKEIDVTALILADLNNDPDRPAIDGGSNKIMSHFMIRWDNEGTFDADLIFDAVEGSEGDPILELNLVSEPLPTDNRLNYTEWITGINGLDKVDPAGNGPTNQWPLILEYGLGSDPSTYTAGFIKSTNASDHGQLGTYSVRALSVEDRSKDYLTMSFDFNHEADDIEIILQESSNLVDWVDTLLLQPPYSNAVDRIALNPRVIEVADNTSSNGYPVKTTRVTARAERSVDDETAGFLKLDVRPTVQAAATPLYLNAVSHDGIFLEWSGGGAKELFMIERAPTGSGAFERMTETANYQYTDTTAVNGQTYDYRVRALNVAGATEWSNIATALR